MHPPARSWLWRKDRPEITALADSGDLQTRVATLPPGGYLLTTVKQADRPVLLIVGGDDIGTLYGAYRLAELLGVRFFLHGDVIPDKQIPLNLTDINAAGKPLFALRGIQPFHDFPEGPDWWNRDEYKAVLGQLPKLGMNFFGLHCYPQGGVGPEPLVWIGPPREIAPDGKVKASYPSRHFTASNVTGAWGYQPGKTSDYVFGAADLFDRDDYGADYMRGTHPWNKMSPEQCDALFDRMGEFLGDVFTFARRMDVKTCLGTETPLTIPTAVKERLQAAGKDPTDPAVVQKVYEGMFRRIAKIHPLDYYWIWTPEGWTWQAVKQEQIDAVTADFRAAIAAINEVKPPFTLATCGWVLGPPQNPSLFDELLPKEMPMSCINREVGNTPVEPGFAQVQGRPKWAIPWMEDDPGMTIPQLWVGRMRRDAADALKYGCTGLMGIHWRTRILAPNVSALAKAAWDQSGWTGKPNLDLQGKPRFAPTADFYADWAGAEFGAEAAEQIAAIFVRLDGRLPRPVSWVTGPGSMRPSSRKWSDVQKEYTFVDELAALRPRIAGPGNLERFDYWLNNFRALRSIAEVRCVWRRFNAAMEQCQGGKGRGSPAKTRPRFGPARPEGIGGRVCRTAAAFAGRGKQFRRDGQPLQLATTNHAGAVDQTGPGSGRTARCGPSVGRDSLERLYRPAAAVCAGGPHRAHRRGTAAAEGDRAGRKTASGGAALAAAGDGRVRRGSADPRGAGRVCRIAAAGSRQRRLRVLCRGQNWRRGFDVSTDCPAAQPDRSCGPGAMNGRDWIEPNGTEFE